MYDEDVIAGVETLRKREKIAVLAMYATMAIFALQAMGEVLELVGVIDLAYFTEDPLTLFYVLILYLGMFIYFGSAILVAMWIHRAHANLHAAGFAGLTFSPGWAIGWYFIPIACLFKPYQAMRELWDTSLQTGADFSTPAHVNMSGWWGFWIVGLIAGNISARISMLGDGTNMEVAVLLSLVSSICMIGSAWLLMQIMQTITAGQIDGIVAAQVFE